MKQFRGHSIRSLATLLYDASSRSPNSLLSMTMHDWSAMVLDKQAARLALDASCTKAGRLQMAMDIHSQLTLSNLKPSTNAFNRLVEQVICAPDDLAMESDEGEGGRDECSSRFQLFASILGAMEEEPLCLRPDERTFELAMKAFFKKKRMIAITEALFQLMQTDKYGLVPTKQCWLYRMAAVMTSGHQTAAHRHYKEFKQLFALDRLSVALLVRAAVHRLAYPFLYDLLLPDVERDKALLMGEADLVRLLSDRNCLNAEGVRFIRWVLQTNSLDSESPKYFNEGLCWRWLDWMATGAMGAGLSDLAEACMNRLIELRAAANGAVPRRFIEYYLRIIDMEVAGTAGILKEFYPTLCVPLSPSALALAHRIKAECGAGAASAEAAMLSLG